MRPHTRNKWYTIGNVLIVLGMAILIFLGVLYFHGKSQRWLASQERQITSGQLIDIPILIPTATPTILPTCTPTAIPTTPTLTPTPSPTNTPTPTPSPPIRIIIPGIEVNQAIVEVGWKARFRDGTAESEWITPAYAVGHHKTSACPGEKGNIVLNGHNNTLGEVFKRLPELDPGDEIFLYTLDREFVYVVEESRTVRAIGASDEERAEMRQLIGPTPDETLTLVSCWPYVTYTHRIFVIAKPRQ
jgi:sortase A